MSTNESDTNTPTAIESNATSSPPLPPSSHTTTTAESTTPAGTPNVASTSSSSTPRPNLRRPRDELPTVTPNKRPHTKATSVSYGTAVLRNQFKELVKNPPDGVQVGLIDDNIYKWRVILEGPEGTPFEGGIFKAQLLFPPTFPEKPPEFKMISEFWHPNFFTNGNVCISILHDPTDTSHHRHEPDSEKWRPVLGVEQILLSVMSLLNEPNTDSAANVAASAQYRDDYEAYKKKVRVIVRKSLDDF